MTTILIARTPSFVYLLSDRRLSEFRTGVPDLDSNATKTILFHRTVVIGYTGLARLPADGRWLPTNEWIGEAIRDVPDAASLVRTLRERLELCFAGLTVEREARKLCVAAGAWGRNAAGQIVPISFTISNFDSGSPEVFEVSVQRADDEAMPSVDTYGVRFGAQAIQSLERQLRKAREHDTSPLVTLAILVKSFREFARRQKWVSVDLLATMLPLPPEQTNSHAIVGGGPNATIPTALFIPARAPIKRAEQFFPTTVLPGMYIASMQLSQDATSPPGAN